MRYTPTTRSATAPAISHLFLNMRAAMCLRFPRVQTQRPVAKFRVRVMRDPVPEVDVQTPPDRAAFGLVPVSHDDDVAPGLDLAGGEAAHAAVLGQLAPLGGVLPALLRRRAGQPEADVGVHPRKKPDAQTVPDDLLQQPVPGVLFRST